MKDIFLLGNTLFFHLVCSWFVVFVLFLCSGCVGGWVVLCFGGLLLFCFCFFLVVALIWFVLVRVCLWVGCFYVVICFALFCFDTSQSKILQRILGKRKMEAYLVPWYMSHVLRHKQLSAWFKPKLRTIIPMRRIEYCLKEFQLSQPTKQHEKESPLLLFSLQVSQSYVYKFIGNNVIDT